MAAPAHARPPTDLVEILAGHQVIFCCGSGGVGKTTVSAALGMGIASTQAGRVLVLTIDPARRLATRLGLRTIGTRPVPIAEERLREAGLRPRGELFAAMLDLKSEWDRVVERHAPNRQTRDRILANRFYRGISEAFIGSQEYMALEALYNFHAGGQYDRIVVDTPPSRSALDFLEAPDRLTDFVSARLLSWLAGPSRIGWRAMSFAATPFLRMADRLLGSEVLAELGAFVRDIQGLYEGVRKRAGAVYDLMRSDRSAFVVVTTLEREPMSEAEFFCRRLQDYSMPLRAVVVNRVLPALLRDPSAAAAATTLARDPEVAAWLRAELGRAVSPDAPPRLGETFLALHRLAERGAAQETRLGDLGRVPIARLPLAGHDVSDLESLGQLARWLMGEAS